MKRRHREKDGCSSIFSFSPLCSLLFSFSFSSLFLLSLFFVLRFDLGQVSLLCQSLPQADEMFKSAIMLVKEAPTRVEEREGKRKKEKTKKRKRREQEGEQFSSHKNSNLFFCSLGKWRNTYTDMFLFLKQFLSVLVAVPGHPGHGAFYLLEQLQKIIQSWDW